MSTLRLRTQTKALIDDLSTPQLRIAKAFLDFVRSRELDPATLELLAIPGFEASYARGTKDVRAGRTTPWGTVPHRKARRNV